MNEKILNYLKDQSDFVSGEEISQCFNMSRAGIWKYIQHFREKGYIIKAVPHLGYHLQSCPDALYPWEIQYNLKTKIFGKEIVYHDTLPSTMEEAFQLAVNGASEGTIVCAERQTQGRGRLGRTWISPKGQGIYMSLILRPSFLPSEVSRLTLMSAVALCEAVNNLSDDVMVRIKWPNDLLINQLKLAGILTELNAEIDRVKFVIVGFGINVNTTKKNLLPTATSLKMELKKKISRVSLAQDIICSLEEWYETVQSHGFSSVCQRWKELSVTLGHQVQISAGNRIIQGRAVDLADDGGLLIQTDTGEVIKKISGEVECLV